MAATKYLADHTSCRVYFEIGRILHLRSEIRNVKLDGPTYTVRSVQFEISGFRI